MANTRTRAAAKNGGAPKVKSAASTNGFVVRVNIEKLTWEDMKIIIGSTANREFTPELVEDIHGLFERVVEGGARAVPVIYTQAAIEAIGQAMSDLGNPKNLKPA